MRCGRCGPGRSRSDRDRRRAQRTLRRCDQGRADGAVGSVRPGLRQAAEGDDPDAAAGARAARPADSSTQSERALVLSVSAATIDRLLVDVKVAAAGGRRRRVGFYSAIRREVPIRTFNDWKRSAAGLLRDRHGGARRHVASRARSSRR